MLLSEVGIGERYDQAKSLLSLIEAKVWLGGKQLTNYVVDTSLRKLTYYMQEQ